MRGSTNLGVIVTASLAGLLFGFDTVVISGVTESVGRVFHLDAGSFWYGFSVASALLGTFIGALVAGVPGDRYGSRDTLKAVGFMYVASALGCAFCWNLESFYVFRFLGGLAIASSGTRLSTSRKSPANRRGALRSCSSSTSCSASLAYISNFVVQKWRRTCGA
jgi:MFS family permease